MKLLPPTKGTWIFIGYFGAFLLVLAILVVIYLVVGHQATGNN